MNLSRLDDVDEEDEDEDDSGTPELEPVAVAITVRYSFGSSPLNKHCIIDIL